MCQMHCAHYPSLPTGREHNLKGSHMATVTVSISGTKGSTDISMNDLPDDASVKDALLAAADHLGIDLVAETLIALVNGETVDQETPVAAGDVVNAASPLANG